jgi:serine/threonine protein kinase
MHAWEIAPQDLQYDASQPPIASGGQADIYRGTWQGIDVALKVARPASEGAKAVFAEFMRREVRALSRCRHPNVIRLYGVCLGERPSVVMPFAAGGSLRDKLEQSRAGGSGAGGAGDRKPVPTLEAVSLMAGIARGMGAVHAHAIIHLDLKPDNILMAFDGTPWITDFGLATSSSAASFSNSAGGRGTQQYMAPELFRSRRKGGSVTSPKADVYSFAVLSWQILTGAMPWQGVLAAEIVESIKDGDRPELSEDGSIDWRV